MVKADAVDVVIVGGGAAGLMCAIEAGRRGRSTIVLERNKRIGEKIRISGGGRCNFTNSETTPENFITENPGFHKSALARYTPVDFVRLVEQHGIRYHEKKLGQLFCDGSSSEIIAMLQKECARAGVRIVTDCQIVSIRKGFAVQTNVELFECESLVVASGGLSIPKIGATNFGYHVAKQFGLRIIPPRPALVPLLLQGPEADQLRKLSGVSLEALVRCGRASFKENILFTHRGLSGPAILQISSYWQPDKPLVINTLGRPPRRFLQVWETLYPSPKNGQTLEEWTVFPAGTEGYAKAEVTAGGVDTKELSSKTMESRDVPGLYFIGEVVDVTGHLGGFNFQWAWASGWAAGQNV
jgi:predicted Rossmann fold flavoprotein